MSDRENRDDCIVRDAQGQAHSSGKVANRIFCCRWLLSARRNNTCARAHTALLKFSSVPPNCSLLVHSKAVELDRDIDQTGASEPANVLVAGLVRIPYGPSQRG